MEAFLKEGFLEDGTITSDMFDLMRKQIAPISLWGDRFWDEMIVRYQRIREEKKKIKNPFPGIFKFYTPEEWKQMKEEERKLLNGCVEESQGFDPSDPRLEDSVTKFAIDVHNKWDKEEGAHKQLRLVEAVKIKYKLLYNIMIHEITLKAQDLASNEDIYLAKVYTCTQTGIRQLMRFRHHSEPLCLVIGPDCFVNKRLRKRKSINLEAQKKSEPSLIEDRLAV